jgi:hypothetical protein
LPAECATTEFGAHRPKWSREGARARSRGPRALPVCGSDHAAREFSWSHMYRSSRGGAGRGPLALPRLSDLAVSLARSAPPFVYLPLGGSGPHGTVVMLPAASLASSEGWPPVLILVVRTPGPGRRSEPGLPGSTVSFT